MGRITFARSQKVALRCRMIPGTAKRSFLSHGPSTSRKAPIVIIQKIAASDRGQANCRPVMPGYTSISNPTNESDMNPQLLAWICTSSGT